MVHQVTSSCAVFCFWSEYWILTHRAWCPCLELAAAWLVVRYMGCFDDALCLPREHTQKRAGSPWHARDELPLSCFTVASHDVSYFNCYDRRRCCSRFNHHKWPELVKSDSRKMRWGRGQRSFSRRRYYRSWLSWTGLRFLSWHHISCQAPTRIDAETSALKPAMVHFTLAQSIARHTA